MTDNDTAVRNPPWKLGETQNPLTGYIGCLSIVAMAILVAVAGDHHAFLPKFIWDFRKVIILVLVILSMIATEIFVFKTHRRNFNFGTNENKPNKSLLASLLGFYTALVFLGLTTLLSSMWCPEFVPLYLVFTPIIAIVAPFYFHKTIPAEKTDSAPDELNELGNWVIQRLKPRSPNSVPIEKPRLMTLWLGLVLKGYFLPFMVVSCISFWNLWETSASHLAQINLLAPLGQTASAQALHYLFLSLNLLLVVIDVTLATIGYLTSSRLLDTQFTSVEPTISGWVAALFCYPPFNKVFDLIIWTYLFERAMPIAMYREEPIFAITLSVMITLLMTIYAHATVVFGLRFSNLTNRGIICSGPYRFVRHPAYVAKNSAWWIALVAYFVFNEQFLIAPTVCLLSLNCTYILRALTEERHLLREEHYLQYCKKVRWRFLPKIY